MLSQKYQPIKPLILWTFDEFTVLGSGQPQGLYLIGPKLNNGCAERPLIHVRPDVIAPPRGKLVKFIMRFRCVAICIPLEIRETDMNNDVNSLQLGQTLEKVERKRSEIVWIEKCKMQS